MTPTQTAQKILKGCKKFLFIDLDKTPIVCGDIKKEEIRLCKMCKATLSAKKEEWQNEILKWEVINNILMSYHSPMLWDLAKIWFTLFDITNENINEYKQAVKLANG